MNKSIYAVLVVLGLGFVGFATTGIYNSSLDSRVLFTIALLSAGMVFVTWGAQALLLRRRQQS